MEMDREGFVVVIELDPSSSLVSVRLSAVRMLNSRTSERNGDRRPLVLAHVRSYYTCGYDHKGAGMDQYTNYTQIILYFNCMYI